MLFRGASGRGWYRKYLAEGQDGFKRSLEPTPFNWGKGDVARPKAYFQVAVAQEAVGKIVFELASDTVPNTVNNFLRLCAGPGATYKGSKIFNIHRNNCIVGGDIETNDGSHSCSALGSRLFPDENYIIPHSGRGLLRFEFWHYIVLMSIAWCHLALIAMDPNT